MKHTLSLSLLSLALASSAQADSGYKIFPKVDTFVTVSMPLQASDLTCSKPDIWGQSDLVIKLPPIEGPQVFPIAAVSRLFDGPCEADLQMLRAAGQSGGVTANLAIKVDEIVTWGIFSQGSDREQPYCQREQRQFVYLRDHELFPEYEYQASNSSLLETLDYQYCIKTYGNGAINP